MKNFVNLLFLITFALTSSCAHAGKDYSNTFVIGAAGTAGNKVLQLGNTGDRGCLQFNDTSNVVQFSNDCSTYTTLAAGATVYSPVSYTTAAGQSISDITVTIVNFGTQVYDPGSIVTTGASWKWDAPRTGYIQICAALRFAAASWGGASDFYLAAYRGGSEVQKIARYEVHATTPAGWNAGINGCTQISVTAGDDVDVRVFHSQGGSLALQTIADSNWVTVNYIDQ